jgi:small multidrug resistance pump
MKPFILLFFAILSEVCATAALRASDGFTRIEPIIVVFVGYAVSFYLLSLTLRVLPLGMVYATWSGLGTVGTAAIGVWLWQERVGLPQVIGITLIVAGVVVLQLFSKTHP